MFEPIFGILKRKKFSFQDNIKALAIFGIFEEAIVDIFDDSFKQKIEPLSFKQGVLKVKVDNSTLAQELQIRKNEIVEAINSKLSENKVKEILFGL
jgi:predicted transcriptional regulator